MPLLKRLVSINDGQKVRHLFGTWHEAMFCGEPGNAECIWKAGDSQMTSQQLKALLNLKLYSS